MENEIVSGAEPGLGAAAGEPQGPRTAKVPVWIPAVLGAGALGMAGGWYLRGSAPDPGAASHVQARVASKPSVAIPPVAKQDTPLPQPLPAPKPIQTVGPPPPDTVAEVPSKGGKLPTGAPLPGLTGSVEPMRPGGIIPGPGATGLTEQAIRGIAEANGARLTGSSPSGNGRIYTVETTSGKVGAVSKKLREAVGLQGVVGDPIYPEETNSAEDESVRALTKRLLDARKRHAELLVAFYSDAPSVKDCEREIASIEKQIQKVKNTPPTPGTKVTLEVTIRE